MGLGGGVNLVKRGLDGGKFSGVTLHRASMGAHVPLHPIFGSNWKSKNPIHSLFQASNSPSLSIYQVRMWRPTRPARRISSRRLVSSAFIILGSSADRCSVVCIGVTVL